MESWVFFATILAEALLIVAVLDFEVELSPALIKNLKKFNQVRPPSSLLGITTWKLLESFSKNSKERFNHAEQTGGYNASSKNLALTQARIKQIPNSSSLELKPNRRFPSAPVAKGYSCPIHNGSITHCATFFEHENYEYKLLCRGELYFRRKGTHAFRDGHVVPKEPGRLFTVKLDEHGSNVAVFCFEPSSRTLGEVNGLAEFLPVQTSIASSQEAHGLVYTQGQGCVFDWVYGNRSSSQYPWDYNLRYDVGWMHSSPTTEELFASSDKLLGECSLFSNSQNPLKHSLEGLDSVGHLPSPGGLGEIQVGFAYIDSSATSGAAHGDEPVPSTSSQPTLPFPLAQALAPQSAAQSPTSPPVTNRSALRRTCSICNRTLRRPSALTIHMNSHSGNKPFQCGDCDYSSTNITNLRRHQNTKHAGSSGKGK